MKEQYFKEEVICGHLVEASDQNEFSHETKDSSSRARKPFLDSELEELNDEELLHYMQSRGRCETCFSILYGRHVRWIVYEARKYVDQVDAEDLTQEFMLCLWKQLPQFKPPYCIRGFARRIIRNNALNMLRKQSRFVSHEPMELEFSQASSDSGVGALNRELWKLASHCLDSRGYRLINMRYFEGFKCSEIAMREEMPVGSVKRILHEARTKLRRFLEKNGLQGIHH